MKLKANKKNTDEQIYMLFNIVEKTAFKINTVFNYIYIYIYIYKIYIYNIL